MKSRLIHYITVFHKEGDTYVKDILFTNFPLLEMKFVFHVDADDTDMVFCYPITTIEQKDYVEQFIEESLDLEQYDYFLEGGLEYD